ncbi:MAG: class I SAM-dependent methyltransferase [Flavobacteriales bacterium]|nr:class I SAM-dependent methyltransferase [Flavobacteriales bacterium]HPF68570.1 class I SAM-dependent methyltransferase [Flavobacteriales bacterium]HRW90934.1 class I SAM-dependent methyltransferase [Flavobacteriales bacterium]
MSYQHLLKQNHIELGKAFERLNRVMDRVNGPVHLRPNMRRQGIMVTTEQRANLALLLHQVLDMQVPGEVVELGCYDGQTAVVLGAVLAEVDPSRKLHLYDNFQSVFGEKVNAQERLAERFRSASAPQPVLHVGDFKDTVPSALPERICFAHIDCGNGDDPNAHAGRVRFCLNAIYDRMPKGAVCVLMDYHDPELTTSGWDANPGVRPACLEFFKNRPERVIPLHGGEFSHGYFRKR